VYKLVKLLYLEFTKCFFVNTKYEYKLYKPKFMFSDSILSKSNYGDDDYLKI